METLRLKTYIGSDGILKIEVPVSVRDTDCEVVVVYAVRPTSAPDDWVAFVNATYGSLADDPIECPEQPPIDIRDDIEDWE